MRIWDVQLPVAPNASQDMAVYPFIFRLPAETVRTGYGTLFPKRPMDLEYYVRMAARTGFVIEERESAGRTFRLVLRKP